MLEGGCLCGAVRYEIDGGLGPIVCCHCSMCRKAQGTAFATNAPVPAPRFRIVAGAGALRKVGRMGIKALIYFEIVTTAALFIGLAVVNLTKPGAGVILATTNTSAIQAIEHSHPKSFVETVVHAFPSSIIEAMVRGDVL